MEKAYRIAVVALLLIIALSHIGSFFPKQRLVVENIRNVFDMEDAVKKQYRDGFRLIAIEQLANDGNPSTKNKTEYVLFFEK